MAFFFFLVLETLHLLYNPTSSTFSVGLRRSGVLFVSWDRCRMGESRSRISSEATALAGNTAHTPRIFRDEVKEKKEAKEIWQT